MSKRGENIYKRKDGRWEGRYLTYKNGAKKYISVYGRTYASVKDKLLTARQNAVIEQAENNLPDCSLTVANLFAKWLREKAAVIKPSSYIRYTGLLNAHLLPALGNCTVSRLTVQKIAAFLQEKLHNGRLDKKGGLSAKTIADILCLIKSAVKMALRDFNLPQAAAILMMRPPMPVRSRKPEILNENECTNLSRQIVQQPESETAAILFCLNTGLRLGEVCALRWSDIDFEAKTLTVSHTVQRVTQNGKSVLLLQSPKTEAGKRTIPLTAEIILMLQRRLKEHSREYVFGTDNPLEPRTLQYRFTALLQKCNIRRRNFHSLRHTFASRFVALGGDVKSLSEILGHANVRTTMQLYVHPSLEQKRADMELVNTMRDLDCA